MTQWTPLQQLLITARHAAMKMEAGDMSGFVCLSGLSREELMAALFDGPDTSEPDYDDQFAELPPEDQAHILNTPYLEEKQ